MVDRYAKFATENLLSAASRIERSGGGGTNVIAVVTFLAQPDMKKASTHALALVRFWLLDLGSNQGPTD